jgi:hypothetical protein
MDNWTNANSETRKLDPGRLSVSESLDLRIWRHGRRERLHRRHRDRSACLGGAHRFGCLGGWLNLIVGLWTMVSPGSWAFMRKPKAMTGCVIVGVAPGCG